MRLAQRAESAGFEAAMCSDHFAPWLETQGHSGFTWSWLGAALQAARLSFGTVCAPGQRCHPAVIAQAAATLTEMYPGVSGWRSAAARRSTKPSPTGFAQATQHVDPAAVLRGVRASADAGRQAAWVEQDAAMGFSRVSLHNVNNNHDRFFDELAPRLAAVRRAG